MTGRARFRRGVLFAAPAAAVVAAFALPGQAARSAPGFRGATTAAGVLSLKLVVPRPAGVRAGDMLVAAVALRPSEPDIRTPPGWTLLRRDVGGKPRDAKSMSQAVYFHVARAGEPRRYQWSFSRKTTAVGGIVAYSGVRAVEPIEAHSGRGVSSTRAVVTPRLATTTPGALVIAFFGKARGERLRASSGLRPRLGRSAGGSAGVALAAGDLTPASPGTLAPRRATGSSTVAAAVSQLVGLTPAPTRAQNTFYVSPGGSDSAPGTLDRPMRSLQRALDAVGPGQKVILRNGTYGGNVELRRSGTAAAPVSVEAFDREHPTLAGRLKITGSDVRVSGLVFDGRQAPTGDVLIWVAGADAVDIIGNEIRGAAQSGVFVGGRAGSGESDPADRVRILGNWIHGNGLRPDLDHGVYWERGRDGLIGNNVIESNRAFGVQLYPDADRVTVTQNTIVANGRSGVIVAGNDSRASDSDVIANNILAANGEYGVRSSWDGPVGAATLLTSNLAFANRAGDFPSGFGAGGLQIEPDNTSGDPLFVSAGDYHLRPESPARDRGRPDYSLPTDRDGRARPSGTAPDIGAYELP